MAPSTVSRAFTNPGRVNHHTREHVLAVAERLGYAPNPAAQALESGRTRTLALLVPDITNPYFAGRDQGRRARGRPTAGLTLVLGDTQENPAPGGSSWSAGSGRRVDGFVLSASRLPDDELLRAAELNPIALVNRAAPGLACVVADFDTGTRQIVDHLASLGHRSFVFLGGPPESWSGARRWAGLRRPPRAARGLDGRPLRAVPPTLGGGPAAADAVARAGGATAVVAHNDMLAIGVMQRLSRARRRRCPDDVSVVGFDDIFGADFCQPPLTTLAERTATPAPARSRRWSGWRWHRRRARPPSACCPPSSSYAGPPEGHRPRGRRATRRGRPSTSRRAR